MTTSILPFALLPSPARLIELAEWLDASGLSDAAAAARSEAAGIVEAQTTGVPSEPVRTYPLRMVEAAKE
ncbi:MAG TPA: hypothetical protein VF594_09340 [Rubricoccaceae bacterium]|jgi:hypothetical protein